jgi:RNA polymerase sigma-70 factor (ECF subfamily)
MKLDQTLIQEIAQGSEPAFEELFNKYYPTVYQYLLRVVKSKEIAEEIASDIFLKLWLGKEMIGDIHSMPAFLRTVSTNKAIDFFRSASRQQNIRKLVEKELNSYQNQPADYQLLDHEYQTLLSKAIEQLSPQRKLVFSLSRVEGLTHEEIAEKLQLSRNTVRNTVVESLKVVRDFLQKHGVDGVAFWLAYISV